MRRIVLAMMTTLNGIAGAFLIALSVLIASSPAPAQTKLRVANWLPVQHPLVAELIKPRAQSRR